MAVGALLSGCSGGKNGDSGDAGAVRGSGQIGTITAAANDSSFTSPRDATPSSNGSKIYFIATGSDGTPGAFLAGASGGAASRLDPGGVLTEPSSISISADGTQLFVSDPAADADDHDAGTDLPGAIFSLPSGGGTPAVVAGTQGLDPRGLVVAGDTLYFTVGPQSPSGAGVYSMGVSGGSPSAVFTGGGLMAPSGIAVADDGTVYVIDCVGSDSALATVYQIAGGQATALSTDLGVGYPAGIALVQDESALFVSGLDPETQTDLVYRVSLGSTPETTSFNTGISAFNEPAGLHRAAGADIYAWADSFANGTGTVYALSK
ncbi:MAG: hypothetical protein FWD17_02540 [Polyangiaceae bacterium]|nr:hypothetical protein [Polyangiaceae bacterium]